MRDIASNKEETPPSSINGDEISPMEDDEEMYYEEMVEIDEDQLEQVLMDDGHEFEEYEPAEDHSSAVFTNHKGSVFCCDLHPNGKLAVTGGVDDKAYVWAVESGQLIMECDGHKDSLIFVGFSFDGAYLATVDMGGLIKVWKVTEQQTPWPIEFEYEADDMNFGLWHFGARVLICGTMSGDIYVFKIPSGDTKVLQGHNVKLECGKLFKDGVRLATAYEDGSLKIWDLKTCATTQHFPPGTHRTSVTALDTHHENNLMASISADGKIVLSTSANGKIVGQIDIDPDPETIAFAKEPQMDYYALGNLQGDLSIWDTTRQMVRHNCAKATDEDKAGIMKIIWANNFIITGCLDGSIRIYDGRSGEKRQVLTGHRSEILDICYNEENKLILTSSEDGTARIFKFDMNK